MIRDSLLDHRDTYGCLFADLSDGSHSVLRKRLRQGYAAQRSHREYWHQRSFHLSNSLLAVCRKEVSDIVGEFYIQRFSFASEDRLLCYNVRRLNSWDK